MKHPGFINKSSAIQPKTFKWSDENIRKINKIIEKYPKNRKQSAVIPVLDLAQRQNNGWLTQKTIEEVGITLEMSFIRVMEIATFYSMFNLEPIGQHFIQICRTTPCWLRGSDKLTNIAKKISGCDQGLTSEDGLFSLVEVECLGACCNAPVVQINDSYFEDLNEENFTNILNNIKYNKDIKTGSQIGRVGSEPKKSKN